MFDVEEFVCESIAAVLGVPSGEVTSEYVIDSPNWDSFSAIEIASRVESTFGIRMTHADTAKLCETSLVRAVIPLVHNAILKGCSSAQEADIQSSPDTVHTARHVANNCRQIFLMYRDRDGQMSRTPSRFLRQTGILRRNYLAFSDLRKRSYAEGISRDIPTFKDFLSWQRLQLEQHFPHADQLFGIGTMSGAMAAIISGHYLRARTVWSFGLLTTRLMQSEGRYVTGDGGTAVEDLREVLVEHNGTTEYHLYFNQGFVPSLKAAESLAGCPGVRLFPQSGDGALVLTSMSFGGQLKDVLSPFEPIDASGA